MTNERFDVQKEGQLALLVQAGLAADLLSNLLSILAYLAQMRLMDAVVAGGTISQAQAASSDDRITFLGWIQLSIFVATAIVWLVWLSRAYRNLKAIGSRTTDEAPAWAVGYWFIPILNLYRPYKIMKELWSRSAQCNRPDFDREPPGTWLLAVWWMTWIATNIFSRVAARTARDAHDAREVLSATKLLILSDVGAAVAAALAILIVARIHQYQGTCAAQVPPTAAPSATTI